MEHHECQGHARPGHQYRNIHFDNSRVHFGDSHGAQPTPHSRVDNCRNALFLTDHIVDREAFKSEKGQRTEGTCEWIRENETYKAWLSGNTKRLWISGGPGKGKTMLSIFLTEELERLVQKKDDTELLFHFCTYQNDKRNNAAAIFRSLAYQLLTKRKGLVSHIASYFESDDRTKMTLSSAEALWIVLRTLLRALEADTIFCVLDGLDECDEASQQLVTSKFHEFFSVEQTEPGFALAIVSRPIRGLGAFDQIKLDPDNDEYVGSDIRQFIFTRVRLLEALGLDRSKRRKIEEVLLRRSQGTFLWVGFVMRELSSKTTCMEIMKTLDVLPSGLPGMYSRMLLQTDRRRRPMISRILRWVTLAHRHLTLVEMADALQIPPAPNLDVDQTISDYLTLCGPMLVVEKTEIRLVHQSARDYLLRSQADSDPTLEIYRVREAEAHAEITTACLDCIERDRWCNKEELTRVKARSAAERTPFYSYAASYWAEHAKSSHESLDWGVQLQRVFFRKWDNTQQECRKHAFYPPPSILHLACQFGIQELVRELLRKRLWGLAFQKPVDEKDRDGNSSLIHAVRENEKASAQLLLEHGANINAKNRRGRTPIFYAIERRNKDMVQLLLENGATLNMKDRDGVPPIAVAIRNGNVAMVKFLRERGAPLPAKGGFEWIPILTEEYLPMMKVLFDNGADANFPGHILLAARRGKLSILRWLLEHGAQTSFERDNSEMPQTALGRAILSLAMDPALQLETVRILLDHGADVNEGFNGGTPLQAASKMGNAAVVKLLLERGAEIEPSVLDTSICRGNPAAAQVLLEWGANPCAFSRQSAAIVNAVGRGDVDMVRLFIDHGTGTMVGNGQTLLQEALQNDDGMVKSHHERIREGSVQPDCDYWS